MLSTFDALFLGSIALLVFYLYMTWNFNYWKRRGIDSDDNVSFLFGNVSDSLLGRKSLGEIITGLYRKFPGKKVVGYFQFRTPALLIRDPEIIRKILVTDFTAFPNNDVMIDADIDPIMGNHIFVLKDNLWKQNRSLITPAFTSGKIKAIFPSMREVAEELVKYLVQHPEDTLVKPIMSRYTTEVVARCAFGLEGDNFKHPKPEMYELGESIWGTSLVTNLKLMSFMIMPAVNRMFRLKIVPSKVVEFFDCILRDMIVYRQEKKVERNDLMQYLIEVKRKTLELAKGDLKSETPKRVYTDQDVLNGCITFFVESYQTTAVTISNVLYQLALHQDVQENLRAEIDEVLKEGELTFEKLHTMNYLHSVFAETNRLIPIVFKMQKLCKEKYEMDIGEEKPLVVEKGTTIAIPLYAIQNDPLHWEEAHLFKPERFSSKEQETRAKTQGIYFPFSDGPRVCPGNRIATTMVKLAVVRIISAMEVHPTERTPRKLEWETNPIFIIPKGGIHLRFIERSR